MHAHSSTLKLLAALPVLLLGACAEPRAAPSAPAAEEPVAAERAEPHGSVGDSSAAASFDASKPADLEVLRARTGHLLVRPVVDGVQSGWFIFDTGAGISCISTPHLEDLHLAPAGELDSQGIGGAEQSKLFTASSLALGPLSLRDQPLLATDLSFLKEHLGQEITGVIGFGLLSECVAEIDLAEGRVALRDPASYALREGAWIPIDLDDRIPALTASVEGHAGRFHLDTGANDGVTLSASATERWKLLEGRAVSDAKLGGVGGFVSAKRGTLERFEIGDLRQENVPATFSLESKGILGGDGLAGSIGAKALTPYVLVTDYANRRIALVPRRAGSAAR